jgi:hypothetical protein
MLGNHQTLRLLLPYILRLTLKPLPIPTIQHFTLIIQHSQCRLRIFPIEFFDDLTGNIEPLIAIDSGATFPLIHDNL